MHQSFQIRCLHRKDIAYALFATPDTHFRLNGRSMLRHDQEQDTDIIPGNSKTNTLIVRDNHPIPCTLLNTTIVWSQLRGDDYTSQLKFFYDQRGVIFPTHLYTCVWTLEGPGWLPTQSQSGIAGRLGLRNIYLIILGRSTFSPALSETECSVLFVYASKPCSLSPRNARDGT